MHKGVCYECEPCIKSCMYKFIVAFPAPNFIFEVIHGHVWCRLGSGGLDPPPPPPPSPCKIKFLNIIELPKIYASYLPSKLK